MLCSPWVAQLEAAVASLRNTDRAGHLSELPEDVPLLNRQGLIPLNLAIAATITYFDMEMRYWDLEPIDGKTVTKGHPLRVSLSQFTLCFPHLLGFTVNGKLT